MKISNKTINSYYSEISHLTDNTGYFDITVSPVDSSATNPFSANEDIIITFARTGDKGETGPQGVQGAQGHQGHQGRQGALGDDGKFKLRSSRRTRCSRSGTRGSSGSSRCPRR